MSGKKRNDEIRPPEQTHPFLWIVLVILVIAVVALFVLAEYEGRF
ncbi:hypothetical protein R4P47_13430 [Rhodococcus sp. IEGM 1370]|nr:hypothetical protein [Rhodococcus sp. IEGM 1370]MDV8077563.1 hypothetical protein [Rhodococcus sp. IEGM 1370]